MCVLLLDGRTKMYLVDKILSSLFLFYLADYPDVYVHYLLVSIIEEMNIAAQVQIPHETL